MPENAKDFRVFCLQQLQRLSHFRQWQFTRTPARKDYRRWLERRCGTRERVERIMNAAVELEEMPTIAALNGIHADLFGQPFAEPEVSLEERQARAVYLRDWYAQEAREAEERRRARQQKAQIASQGEFLITRLLVPNRITEADFEREREKRREQGAKAEVRI